MARAKARLTLRICRASLIERTATLGLGSVVIGYETAGD